jgi:hypothetical protein
VFISPVSCHQVFKVGSSAVVLAVDATLAKMLRANIRAPETFIGAMRENLKDLKVQNGKRMFPEEECNDLDIGLDYESFITPQYRKS